MRKIFIFYSLIFLLISSLNAQTTNKKFGDVKADDFATKIYSIDSSANGVVLFDIGSTEFEGSNNGWFNITTKRHTRMHLLNRNAFDMATFSIPLYSSATAEERIESLEAVTYNLENGNVTTSKLDKNSIFKDRLNKYLIVKKFTLPNLQEGSIIEIKYKLVSPYPAYITPWKFQGFHPVLKSEYTAVIPGIFDFIVLNQGFLPFKEKSLTGEKVSYNILIPGSAGDRSEMARYEGTAKKYFWSMENVPALKNENYITTLDNYVSKIEFALARIINPNSPVRDVMSNWYKISENLLGDEDFGAGLSKNNGWMKDELKNITEGISSPVLAAQKIYHYIQSNMTCTDHTAKYLSAPLKQVFDTKKGNVADINLLLIAFLIKQGFQADPVLLSTRNNGKAWEEYPMLDKLNYVIARTVIDDKEYLLDASEEKLGFGKLPLHCYNGFARVINVDRPFLINLSADSLREAKVISMFIINDDKGKMIGSCTENLGEFSSQLLREKLMKVSKEDYFKELKKSFSFEIKLKETIIDSLKIYENPVAVKFDFSFDLDEDIIYFNPMLAGGFKENLFSATERYYPVEMPFSINETFVLRMDIPKGYVVEEIPKSNRVKFNEDEGMFEYIVAKDDQAIQFRSSIKLNKANFLPEDYDSLREFFGFVVKKHSEQIVFKKIKS